MNKTIGLIGVLILGAALIGCSGGAKNDGEPDAFKNQANDANALAKSVDGNFDKLTAAQKKDFLSLAGGNEKQARTMMYYMAHPPGETNHIPSGPPK